MSIPQCFQKAYFPGASKGVIVWEWVKTKEKEYVIETCSTKTPRIMCNLNKFKRLELFCSCISLTWAFLYCILILPTTL